MWLVSGRGAPVVEMQEITANQVPIVILVSLGSFKTCRSFLRHVLIALQCSTRLIERSPQQLFVQVMLVIGNFSLTYWYEINNVKASTLMDVLIHARGLSPGHVRQETLRAREFDTPSTQGSLTNSKCSRVYPPLCAP